MSNTYTVFHVAPAELPEGVTGLGDQPLAIRLPESGRIIAYVDSMASAEEVMSVGVGTVVPCRDHNPRWHTLNLPGNGCGYALGLHRGVIEERLKSR